MRRQGIHRAQVRALLGWLEPVLRLSGLLPGGRVMTNKRFWVERVIGAMWPAPERHPDYDAVETALRKLNGRELAAIERLIATGKSVVQENAVRTLREAAQPWPSHCGHPARPAKDVPGFVCMECGALFQQRTAT